MADIVSRCQCMVSILLLFVLLTTKDTSCSVIRSLDARWATMYTAKPRWIFSRSRLPYEIDIVMLRNSHGVAILRIYSCTCQELVAQAESQGNAQICSITLPTVTLGYTRVHDRSFYTVPQSSGWTPKATDNLILTQYVTRWAPIQHSP